jgi:hypothetical protein
VKPRNSRNTLEGKGSDPYKNPSESPHKKNSHHLKHKALRYDDYQSSNAFDDGVSTHSAATVLVPKREDKLKV